MSVVIDTQPVRSREGG